jgi:flavin-dependent dehydrogenase
MLLARRGHRVLLVDRATMPSDTLSTHNLVPTGMVMLRRWGLLDRLTATDCPLAARTRITLGDTTFNAPIDEVAGINTTCAPRRSVIDAILTEAAVESGVEVRLETSVRGLLWSGERVIGVSGHDQNRESFTAHGAVVVGADGVNSFVARGVGAATYRRRPSDNCVYYAYWHGLSEPDTLELALVPGRAMAIFPTHDGNACVLAARSASEWNAYRRHPEEEYLATLSAVPAFADRVLAGRRVSRFFGTADLPNHFRRASGAGWALVGDAGLVKDPGPGRGMSDAFRQANRLAIAIDYGLRCPRAMDRSLEAYGVWRDETFGEVYETTVDLARYDWTLEDLSSRLSRHGQAIAAENEGLAVEDNDVAHLSSEMDPCP